MLPFRTKLSYGIGGISDNALYTLTGTYLMLYLTTVAGVNPAVAGTISAAGSVWEAVIGPFMGFKSDMTISRYGKRKPFLMMASVPVAVVTSLLFTSFDAPQWVKILYYLFMIICFWTAFSCEFVPYLSWGADLTEDYNERTVLRSYAYVFNQVGMAIGMVLPTIIVDYAMNWGRSLQQSWQLVGVCCGLCAGLSLLICSLTIHEDDNPNFVKPVKGEKAEGMNIKKMLYDYKGILGLKPIRYLLGASVVYLIANTIFSSDRVYFMTYNLGLGNGMITVLMLIITLSGVAFVPFLEKASRRYDKKNVFLCIIGTMGMLMICFRFIGVESLTACIALCLIYSLANTAYWQLMPSMIYDVCEVEELENGEKKTGAIISLQALSESLSIALGLQALGIILSLSGFMERVQVQPEKALLWIENSFTLIPGIFMVAVALIMKGYPINRQAFEKVLEKLEEKRKKG